MVVCIVGVTTVTLVFGIHIWNWPDKKQAFKDLGLATCVLLVRLFFDIPDVIAKAVGLEGGHMGLAVIIGGLLRCIGILPFTIWHGLSCCCSVVAWLYKKIVQWKPCTERGLPLPTSEDLELI